MTSIQLLLNQRRSSHPTTQLPTGFDDVERFHRAMESCRETPLYSLHLLAGKLGVKIYLKKTNPSVAGIIPSKVWE